MSANTEWMSQRGPTFEPCPQCHFPMVWSTENSRRWCGVYGDHPTVLDMPRVLPLGGGRNLLRLIPGGYNQHATREAS